MLKHWLKIALAVLSLLIAAGVGWQWLGSYGDYSYSVPPQGIYRVSAQYDSNAGGWGSGLEIGSSNGGIVFVRAVGTLPSYAQIHQTLSPLPAYVAAEIKAGVEQEAAHLRAVNGLHQWIFGSTDSDDLNYLMAVLLPLDYTFAPNWKYGGFDFGATTTNPGWANSPLKAHWVCVPDWFVICLALIWPAIGLLRSSYWRAGRRLLAGRCPHCGAEKTITGACSECAIGQGWMGRRVQRLGRFAFMLWWIVPLVLAGLALLAIAITEPSSTAFGYGFGWPGGFIGLAFLYMLGVLIIRAFIRRLPVAEPPRGFAVVVAPPGQKNDGPGTS